MKQSKLVKAYKAIDKIKDNSNLPAKTAYMFYKIRKQLQPHWDFQLERESVIFNKHNVQQKENGSLVFQSDEDREAFVKEINELADLEIDFDVEEKYVYAPSGNTVLSIEDMEALEDFLDYE